MTERSQRASVLAADGEVSEEGERATISLNGAVVLRPAVERSRRRRAAAPGSDAGLRRRVERLRAATIAELERRRDEAGLEPADSIPVPVRRLSSIGRELPRLALQTPRLLGAAAASLSGGGALGALRGSLALLAEQRRLAARPLDAADDIVDEFGFDREWTESLLPVFRYLYRSWWRVQVEGLENVPGEGRALLVSNHAGVMPYDGAMIRMALFDEHPARRHARALILNAFFGVPVVSWFLRRTGNTLAHPDDALRLLERDELVLVFPEGAKGTGKLYSERYRLRRFGRGGFVSLALRTGAPLIPVSVVGSEEVHPMIANLTPVAAAIGMPFFPITPTFPLLGPLGLVPLPSSWRIRFGEPIETAHLGRDRADDAAMVMQLTDRVRDTIQAGLYELLEARGSVFA